MNNFSKNKFDTAEYYGFLINNSDSNMFAKSSIIKTKRNTFNNIINPIN